MRPTAPHARTVAPGDAWLAALDPAVSSRIRKTHLCVITSPPEMRDYLRSVMAAPMITGSQPAPFRIPVSFEGKAGLIVLDQVRTLDRQRLTDRLSPLRLRARQDKLLTAFPEKQVEQELWSAPRVPLKPISAGNDDERSDPEE